MSDDVEKRIEAARQEADRQKQTREFLDSLKPGDETVRHIHNPEAFVMREKARGQASRGELLRSGCTHPLAYIQQYVDDDPLVVRKGNPVNLFVCGVCGMLLWFADPWGNPVSDD